MADSKISALPAVVTPVVTAEVAVNEGGVSKRMSVTQILGLASGGDVFKVGTPVNNEVGVWTGDGTLEGESGLTFLGGELKSSKMLPGLGVEAAPSLAFQGDTSTGIFRPFSSQIGFSLGGTEGWRMLATVFNGKSGGVNRGASLLNVAPSAIIPTVVPSGLDFDTGIGTSGANVLSLIAGATEIASLDSGGMKVGTGASNAEILLSGASTTNPNIIPLQTDPDTGIGGDGADVLSLIAGGQAGLRLFESNSGVVQVPDAQTTVTAFATGGQGSATLLDTSYT